MINIVNPHSKNRTGVLEYHLDEKRVDDGTAFTLKGNAEFTKHLIKTCKYKHKYLSGVIRFADEDVVSEKQERAIMDNFEKMFFVGLDASQYNILWVKHTDKGVTELNYITPRLRLDNGKSLDLYSHKRDLPLFSQWQNGINKHYGLANPYDESRERTAEERHEAKYSGKYKQNFILNRKGLDHHLQVMVKEGVLTSRDDILEYLVKEKGCKITRKGEDYISVKHELLGKKALKLKARPIYCSTFKSLADLPQLEVAAKTKKAPDKPIEFDKAIYDKYLDERRARHFERFGTPSVKEEFKELIQQKKEERNGRKRDRDIKRRVSDAEKYIQRGAIADINDCFRVDTRESGRDSQRGDSKADKSAIINRGERIKIGNIADDAKIKKFGELYVEYIAGQAERGVIDRAIKTVGKLIIEAGELIERAKDLIKSFGEVGTELDEEVERVMGYSMEEVEAIYRMKNDDYVNLPKEVKSWHENKLIDEQRVKNKASWDKEVEEEAEIKQDNNF